jgi:hypothetical protein
MTIFIADSHSFTIPTSSHSPGLWLPGGYASHDLYPAPLGASLHCPGRSLFSPIASPGDTGVPDLSVGTTPRHSLVSHTNILTLRDGRASLCQCDRSWLPPFLTAGRTRPARCLARGSQPLVAFVRSGPTDHLHQTSAGMSCPQLPELLGQAALVSCAASSSRNVTAAMM